MVLLEDVLNVVRQEFGLLVVQVWEIGDSGDLEV